MKINKLLIILIILVLIIILSIYALGINKKKEKLNLKNYNYEYEFYLNKEINGTELATLINKAINQNEKNKIKKDKNNHYIENEENSIKIDVEISLTKKTYSMEEFFNNDTAEFVKFFSEENFKCTNIEYHKKNGKISRLIFTQI